MEQLGQLKGEKIGGFSDVESCGISCEALRKIHTDHERKLVDLTTNGFVLFLYS